MGRPQNKRGNEDKWLWPRVEKTDGCWLWRGPVGSGGYGMVKVEGRQQGVHRVVMGMPDSDVLHRCGVRLCCNPSHLYLGDDKQNAADRDRDGRTARHPNTSNPQAKLTQEAVDDIRSAHVSLLAHAQALADKYGIGIRHVYRIRKGERWMDQ